jgi:hypothetical protein
MRTIGQMVWPVRSESKWMLSLPTNYSYSVCPVTFYCQKIMQTSLQSFQGCPLSHPRIVVAIRYQNTTSILDEQTKIMLNPLQSNLYIIDTHLKRCPYGQLSFMHMLKLNALLINRENEAALNRQWFVIYMCPLRQIWLCSEYNDRRMK